MSSSDIPADVPSSPNRVPRDIGFWLFGVVTAIAVNLLTNDVAAAARVAVAALAISGVLLSVYQLRRIPPSSALRHYASPVAVTVVSPLIFASVLGVGGGYLTFLAAAIVAVAVSSEKNVKTALTLLTGMTGIAGGALIIAGMLRYPPLHGERVLFWVIAGYGWLGGIIAIVFGGAVLARGDRLLLRAMDAMTERPFALMRLAFLGLLGLAGLISSLRQVHSVRDAADGLPWSAL
ncbi:hypothetical protein AB0G04_10510 [Actinoplanes sp. NPDC023801]|uniref:hypothetical protein n=1 Tax=Actinoplanes sp. NPDC023801 TaxID=3154595 RepID=UPI0033E1F352